MKDKLDKKEQEFEDGTKDFLIDGTIKYILPDDIEPTEVSGQENYWIRARLVGGDYGKETFLLKEERQDSINNGTRTLEHCREAGEIWIGALVNYSAVCRLALTALERYGGVTVWIGEEYRRWAERADRYAPSGTLARPLRPPR